MTVMDSDIPKGLADLSCDTADQIEERPRDYVRVLLSVDDLTLEECRVEPCRSEFEYEHFIFSVSQMKKDGAHLVNLSCLTSPDYEWFMNTQMRIRTGPADAAVLKVVDKDVFEFYPRCDPVSVELMSDEVAAVKFEIRILNKVVQQLPTFEQGDLVIRFSDGTSIKVYRHLLGLYSPYIKKCTEDSAITEVEEFPKEAFIEMLYQIYPTIRPIYRNVRDLAKAIVAFQATPIIYQLSKHLVNYNTRAMTLEQKLRAALELELCQAIEELVYRAAQDGLWGHLIKLGFEPEIFFGPEVYRKVVCPAIVMGRQNPYGAPFVQKPYMEPDFFSEESAKDKSNVGILFRSTPFYVNRGIIEVNGVDKFALNPDGLLQALFTREMEEQCAKSYIIPGEVLVSLFSSFYPLGPAVPIAHLRAAIVFCHDHDWLDAKSKLEQALLQQPPDSCEAYRDQITFAEKFALKNMLNISIQRAEGSCNDFANELIKRGDFNLLSQSTRDSIMDRVCSGWGLEPKLVNRLATREPTSFRERQVGLMRGGPRAFEDECKAATLAEMMSDYYFGPVEELCVIND